jgi:hypothetical protein
MLSDPFALTLARVWARLFGSYYQKERYGVLGRSAYAYGLLRCAMVARYFGLDGATVCEFGVAEGNGLLSLIQLAAKTTEATGVRFRIVGFDTGEGLPRVESYKDHPELWSPGDFPMVDKAKLLARLNGQAEIVFGDVGDTVPAWLPTVTAKMPIGFVSIDVDLYSSTVSALRAFSGAPEQYLPAVSMYLDDTSSFFHNDWCGELAAVREFNERSALRKIDQDRNVDSRPMRRMWHEKMRVVHILDHPARNAPRERSAARIEDHAAMLQHASIQ